MDHTLLLLHSLFRYFVMALLIIVIVRSFTGWQSKREFNGSDNKFSLFLLITTHIQFLLGLVLYFVSPIVIKSGASMKDPIARYWFAEHITIMLIAIVLITVARSTSKRLTDSTAKHKRLFVLNTIALVVIIAAIAMMKDRGFFTLAS
ncbi:MAG: cytochrome B [Azospira oryzae]|nr:MAG: cytochrome B [Azospira oryzae]